MDRSGEVNMWTLGILPNAREQQTWIRKYRYSLEKGKW
jgi:hypothetical protein